MLIIQVLIVAFALYALSRTFLRFRNRLINGGEWVLWSFFWIAVAVFVMKPKITQTFADILGVGRGADAVFYFGMVGLSYAFFRLYLRTRLLEQHLTVLVRRLALEARRIEEASAEANTKCSGDSDSPSS